MVLQRDFFGPVTNSSVGRSLATPRLVRAGKIIDPQSGQTTSCGGYSTAEFILGVDVEYFPLLVKRDLSLLPLF
jgi:hypothetical protein